jgi:iron(III) transport system permease protein
MNAALIESASRWRILAALAILALVVFPTVTMLANSIGSGTNDPILSSFVTALQNGLWVAIAVVLLSFLVGLPLGVFLARYQFPFRSAGLAVIALPLLMPTFLWALGWSSIFAIRGFAGAILSVAAPSVSLVALTALISARSLSASQVEAAFLAGGESAVLKHTAGYVAVPAASAALLAGLLSLSDPGPGQIFGLITPAGEVLTSFSAFYNYSLAARQCLMLAAIVLVIALPFSAGAAPRIASEILVRQTRVARLSTDASGRSLALVMVVVILAFLALPLSGLILPVISDVASFGRAWDELVRTAGSTALYAIGGGVVASLVGGLFAAATGRSHRLRTVGVACCFVLLAVPAAVTGLSFVQMGARSPEFTDLLFRSQFAVTLAVGARFFPVAALIAMRSWNAMPKTWAFAGAIHGISLPRYLRSVVIPFLAPSFCVSVILCGLLAMADVTTVLLVHPPGQSSLPLTIFTIMANAPQALVAALCLIYVFAAAILLTLFLTLDKRSLT